MIRFMSIIFYIYLIYIRKICHYHFSIRSRRREILKAYRTRRLPQLIQQITGRQKNRRYGVIHSGGIYDHFRIIAFPPVTRS